MSGLIRIFTLSFWRWYEAMWDMNMALEVVCRNNQKSV